MMDVDEVGQSIELEMEIDEEESIVMELDADMPEVGTDVGRPARSKSQTQFMEIEPEPGSWHPNQRPTTNSDDRR